MSEEQAEERYGPKWRDVLFVLDRIGSIKLDEAVKLSPPWPKATEAAKDNFWAASVQCGRVEQMECAMYDAQEALLASEEKMYPRLVWSMIEVVRSVAGAVSVHDQIDNGPFTEEDYRKITAGWVRTLGEEALP